MFVDKQLLLSDEQDIGLAGGTQVSTNTIDLSAARAAWRGRQVYVVIVIDEAFLTSTSINFQVVTDTVAALSHPTVQIETGAIVVGSLTLNRAPIVIPIGSALGTKEQYLGLNYVEAGVASTAGKVTAFVALDAPTP